RSSLPTRRGETPPVDGRQPAAGGRRSWGCPDLLRSDKCNLPKGSLGSPAGEASAEIVRTTGGQARPGDSCVPTTAGTGPGTAQSKPLHVARERAGASGSAPAGPLGHKQWTDAIFRFRAGKATCFRQGRGDHTPVVGQPLVRVIKHAAKGPKGIKVNARHAN